MNHLECNCLVDIQCIWQYFYVIFSYSTAETNIKNRSFDDVTIASNKRR